MKVTATRPSRPPDAGLATPSRITKFQNMQFGAFRFHHADELGKTSAPGNIQLAVDDWPPMQSQRPKANRRVGSDCYQRCYPFVLALPVHSTGYLVSMSATAFLIGEFFAPGYLLSSQIGSAEGGSHRGLHSRAIYGTSQRSAMHG